MYLVQSRPSRERGRISSTPLKPCRDGSSCTRTRCSFFHGQGSRTGTQVTKQPHFHPLTFHVSFSTCCLTYCLVQAVAGRAGGRSSGVLKPCRDGTSCVKSSCKFGHHQEARKQDRPDTKVTRSPWRAFILLLILLILPIVLTDIHPVSLLLHS